MVRKFLFPLVYIFFFYACTPSPSTDFISFVESNADSLVSEVMLHADKYEFQMIYTRIVRDGEGNIDLDRISYNLDTSFYFYPASTIKMPVAFLAFQRINELRKDYPQLSIHTPVQFDSARTSQTAMRLDSCSETGGPTIASLADQVFAISDNNAYNRLYEFLGQDYINNELRDKGIFTNSRIITRVGVGGFSRQENKYVNPVVFLKEDKSPLVSIPARFSEYIDPTEDQLIDTKKGMGYVKGDSTIMEAFDMSQKNFINLSDLEKSLIHFIYPEIFPKNQRYHISESDRAYLLSSMEKLPHDFPCYQDNAAYNDGYAKFFMYGDFKEAIPDHIIIKNKVGLAYGYLTDIAHIKDTKNEIEFFLSATIHVNDNKIYNDGIYEYDETGIPFLAKLGRLAYAYELEKK